MTRTIHAMRDALEEEARATQSAEIGEGTSAAEVDVDMEVMLIEQAQAHLAAHVAL
jgi:hypothetical protein